MPLDRLDERIAKLWVGEIVDEKIESEAKIVNIAGDSLYKLLDRIRVDSIRFAGCGFEKIVEFGESDRAVEAKKRSRDEQQHFCRTAVKLTSSSLLRMIRSPFSSIVRF